MSPNNVVKNFFPVITVVLILLIASADCARANYQETGDTYDEEVLKEALVNGVVLGIPGISVAIGKGDSIAWTGTASYSDLLAKEEVKTGDKFGIGSITKTFVAVVILQLVEEGKLDLDKVPADYLNQEIVMAVPNTDRASLRDLLNHQSGIPTWEFQADWIRKGRGEEMDLDHTWGKEETLEYVSRDDTKADFEPGERYSYSNTNYTILGLIIEAVTGNDVMTEIRKRVFQPLNIDNTYLESFEEVPGGYVHHYHYATPQFEKTAGVHKNFPEIRPYLVESTAGNLSPEWAAGGMISTACDLVRWARALRDGELLGDSMQKEHFTYYPPAEGTDSRRKYMQGISMIEDFIRGKDFMGHSGGTLGFTAMMYWIEGTDIIVVSLANVGSMHSGLRQSPPGLFYRDILLPAVMRYFHYD
ncbi:MAG: serine hydrolase domain-containing protein [Bacteroidota bacterium]|nr:serine hydrolase domain-containing protein [Bacteroidota bacterium]